MMRHSRSKLRLPKLKIPTLSAGGVATGAAGMIFALGAFASAATGIGIPVPAFHWAGPFAYAEQRTVVARNSILAAKPPSKQAARQHIAEARALLPSAPLSSALMQSVAIGLDAVGDKRGAARAMAAANRLSRRDGMTQMWLATEALGRKDAVAGLKHFDTFLRTYKPADTAVAIDQMVVLLRFPEARRELARYVTPGNPWYNRFISAAVARAPAATHVADLLLGVDTVPDSEFLRAQYAELFKRLMRERAYAPALRLYPRLPGAKPDVLRTVSVTRETLSVGYRPAIWDFSDDADQGGSAIDADHGAALEFYASTDTVGVAGRKLFELPASSGPQAFYWTVVESSTNLEARARWRLRCLVGPSLTTIESVDLLGFKPGTRMRLALPPGCRLAMLEMQMSGGIGRDAARVVVDRLALEGVSDATGR